MNSYPVNTEVKQICSMSSYLTKEQNSGVKKTQI